MAAVSSLDRPLFVVGCGRSGTTLVYEMLCGHERLGWFSTYTDRWPGVPQLAMLSRPYSAMRQRGPVPRRLPMPSEGYRIWDRCCLQPIERRSQPLFADDAHPTERERLTAAIFSHLRCQGRERFVNKNTRNARRVGWLTALLPAAKVIHVLREPRATVSSLLNVAFWRDLRLHWRDNRSTAELLADGVAPEVLAAELWRNDVARARADGERLGSERYLEVRYEAFLSRPREQLERITGFAGLENTAVYRRFTDSFRIVDTGQSYRQHLSADQVRTIDRITRPVAEPAGYVPDA